MTTIKDIARLSGYSIGTVSRVINDHPDVSDAAREKIKAIIAQENYRPNVNAKNMKVKANDVIAILVKGQASFLFAEILEPLQNRFDEYGQATSVHYLDENDDEVKKARSLIIEEKPKGLIFLGGSLKGYDEILAEYNIPTVLLTNFPYNSKSELISSYTTDDEDAAYHAIKTLIEDGHNRIGIIGGNDIAEIAKRRVKGAFKALEDHMIDLDETYYEPSRFSLDGGYTAVANILDRHPDLSAIFALSDTIALGALRCLYDRCFKVPDDISLIGFDGIELGQYAIPRLTTIHQDIEGMAKKAASDILLRIATNKKGVHKTIPYQFVKGATVKKLNEGRKDDET